MSRSLDPRQSVAPSATPTEAEIAAWQDLTDDEQVRRLTITLAHPDCVEVSPATMSDILCDAQAAAKASG